MVFLVFSDHKGVDGVDNAGHNKSLASIEPMHVRNQFGMIAVASKTAYCLAVYEMLIGPAFGIHNNAA